MGLTKLRRRRLRANYSHTEPVLRSERDQNDRVVAVYHVANRDVRGDGVTIGGQRSLKAEREVEKPKRQARPGRDFKVMGES